MSKKLGEQALIRADRVEKIITIIKRTCSSIRDLRVIRKYYLSSTHFFRPNGVAGVANGGGVGTVGNGNTNHHTETMAGNAGSSSTSSGGNSGDERWYVTSFCR